MPFTFKPLALPDVVVIDYGVFSDGRGKFSETYQARAFAEAGIHSTFVQDNQSGSRNGVLRGLHYQIHHPQGKLVRVLAGEVFDVAVDMRRPSPTFGHWVGAPLSADNHCQLWIPEGFAHGFYVLSEWADVLYKATDIYAPEWERTLIWNDPAVSVKWPLAGGAAPFLSEKDAEGARLDQAETYTWLKPPARAAGGDE
jgi:dTDP-4-dehydrorhamnose 3,5-epimerase